MVIKYYDSQNLVYTNRKRFKEITEEPFFEENQLSVLINDGATTTIKTNRENICNYVTIDDTRWYVTSYTYLNGKQVQLNLQRDVIGEFGLDGCFGQIERGYTNSILKNRKELGLNQILKKRISLKPNTNIYGNYYLKPLIEDTHDKEVWGVLYLNKPEENKVIIPIPEFYPNVLDYDFIENNTVKNVSFTTDIKFEVIFVDTVSGKAVKVICIYTSKKNNNGIYEYTLNDVSCETIEYIGQSAIYVDYTGKNFYSDMYSLAYIWGNYIAPYNSYYKEECLSFPSFPDISENVVDYDGVTIIKDDKYYSYNVDKRYFNIFGNIISKDNCGYVICDTLIKQLGYTSYVQLNSNLEDWFNFTAVNSVYQYEYNYKILSEREKGTLTIDVSNENLVDEPYFILVIPLFNTTIKSSIGADSSGLTEYNIQKLEAFNVFNSVIQTLSGDNGYLVDAQIYPYCPLLTKCVSSINGIPFFAINSTKYEHYVSVSLGANMDVKKEYIEREYSIVSPEQSSKFTFNFYDYVNKFNEINGKNEQPLEIIIKTSLKPFAIISSAVIQPYNDTLAGITYDSDLKGSQPTSNGFECSLSNNAFETYKRNNSNYQQLFDLEKQQMIVADAVETVNDVTGAIVNTVTATAMGAIGGNAMGDAGIAGLFGTKTAGAVAGAAAAGGTVSAAMAVQVAGNMALRAYELYAAQKKFDLEIGTIKNIPNQTNRISSFNEIILQDFWYIIEIYECSEYEKSVVDAFISEYGYGIGVFDFLEKYQKDGWFLRATLVKSNYNVNLHLIAENELAGGIYYYGRRQI